MTQHEITGTVQLVYVPPPGGWPAQKMTVKIDDSDTIREFEFEPDVECPAKAGDSVRIRFEMTGKLGSGKYEGRCFNTDMVLECVTLESTAATDMPF